MSKATILLTGATGYIASHTWLALLSAGFRVVGLDNFANSSPEVLNRLRRLSGQEPAFERGDVCDGAAVEAVFERYPIDAVVHFAALKAVGESAQKPLLYYANNLGGLMAVCEAMRRHGSKRMVFSSSATVYGTPVHLPFREDHPLAAVNTYGRTKLMGETILTDLEHSDPQWKIALLRYFNPVGAHPSGLIGEDPRGMPNNLMPILSQVALGVRPHLVVYGDDYETRDGTGIRDYVHVVDLATGHVAALDHLARNGSVAVFNLGTGVGTTVLELVRAFERASGRPIPLVVGPRRPGDVAASWCDVTKAHRELGWRTRRDIDDMCADSWRWQSANPSGYRG